MFTWLSDYLRDRTVYMTTTSEVTTGHAIRPGAPQAVVLSHILFNICLVGLPKVLPPGVNISLYADDIWCVWCSGRNRRSIKHTSNAATGDRKIGTIPEKLGSRSCA